MTSPFILFIVFFAEDFSFNIVQLIHFFLSQLMLLVLYVKVCHQIQSHKFFSNIFEKCMVSYFAFIFIVHFKLSFSE